MIGTIDIKINAAKPNFPLSPFYAFINSPSQVRVVNVPRQIGDWQITAVYVTANYPDNQSASVSCTLTGGCWHGTLPASTATGTSTNGFTITANGVKEDGTTAVTGYVLGKGDLAILDTDGTITVGGTTYYLHLQDSQPETPHKGDICLISGSWKIYNGTAWVGFGGGGGDVAHSDFESVNALADDYTLADVKGKVNQVLNILKGTTASLLLSACCFLSRSSFADISVKSARLDTLPNSSFVVTNVSGAATDPGVVSNIVEAYGYATTGQVETCCSTLAVSATNHTDTATNVLSVSLTDYADAVAGQAYSSSTVFTTNKIAEVNAVIATWEQFLDGSNVVFSITNYISGTCNLDAAKLRILEMTNGVYHEVYNSRDEIALHMTDFKTNDFAAATNEIVSSVDAKIDTKAPLAWGRYSSSGVDIHSLGVTNAVYLSAPSTYFGGGYDWYKVSVGDGAVCVLTANGASSHAYGDDGTFYFKDLTTTNYFGFKTRDNFLIGCDADKIHTKTVSGDTIVVIQYDIDASTYPILLYAPTLSSVSSNAWEQLNDANGEPVEGATYEVAWTNDVDTFTAFINVGTNGAGFFTARTMVAGEAEFRTNMKATFDGGIVTTDGAHVIKPVYSNGELTWRTFDYGSGIQVSTPSSSQVNQIATAKAQSALEYGMVWTATNFLDNSYADYVATNYLGFVYHPIGGRKHGIVVITNNIVQFGGNASISYSNLKLTGTRDGSIYYKPMLFLWDDVGTGTYLKLEATDDGDFNFGSLIDDPLEYTTSKLTPDGSPVMTSNMTVRVAKNLSGVTYDFQNGTNFTLRLYETLTNVIERLGGTVANPPTFD